jgi:hypothetical protein
MCGRPPLSKEILTARCDRVRFIHVYGLLHAALGRWP